MYKFVSLNILVQNGDNEVIKYKVKEGKTNTSIVKTLYRVLFQEKTKMIKLKFNLYLQYFGIDNYNMGIIHIIDISSKDKDINHNGKFLISITLYYSLLNYSIDFDQVILFSRKIS